MKSYILLLDLRSAYWLADAPTFMRKSSMNKTTAR